MPQVEELVLACAEQGVRTTIAADIFSIGLVKSGISYFGGMPLIHFQTPPGDSWKLFLKRAIDGVVSGLLLVLLSPLFVFLAMGVKTSPGPVFFRQTRMGLNGRLFEMFKFRSMYVGAEKDLQSLREKNEMRGPAFKMRDDPRITPFGRFMRRFSLDELPQLWNVFIGDMSLVGPRPPIPGEVSLYERKSRRRLSMRPGLTCKWQVSGRNEISDFDSWVKLDLDYIDNWSLTGDLLLLIKTVPAVLLGTGAR
jgi:exopolysaccharide biosynthesis polyprenyl glycosylphosphotransferase